VAAPQVMAAAMSFVQIFIGSLLIGGVAGLASAAVFKARRLPTLASPAFLIWHRSPS
jgi:hypothetical protein